MDVLPAVLSTASACALAVISFFLKRTVSDFDKAVEKFDTKISAMSKELAAHTAADSLEFQKLHHSIHDIRAHLILIEAAVQDPVVVSLLEARRRSSADS